MNAATTEFKAYKTADGDWQVTVTRGKAKVITVLVEAKDASDQREAIEKAREQLNAGRD